MDKIGNSDNGGHANKPTIPAIKRGLSSNFIVGEYNNNNKTVDNPSLFITNDNLNYNKNNPINGNNWVCNTGTRSLKFSNGLKPNNFSYSLNDSYIPDTEENSQTFPYNANSQFIQGSTTRHWTNYVYENINNSINNIEQIVPLDKIVPQELPQQISLTPQEEREQQYIYEMVGEM